MPGKLQPEVLRESVLDFAGAVRDDLLVGGGIGEDAALIRVPDGILVAASDPVTGAGKNAGKLLVHINANDVACKGADPSWLIVTLIVPDSMGAPYIRGIMLEIHEACAEMGIAVAGGHTELTDRYTQPVLSATMLGITRHELSAKKIQPGDVILVTGHAGLEGMSIIANDRPDLLAGILTPEETETVRSWGNDFSVVKPARILRDFARYMHDPTEGGINGALYEMQEGSGLSLEIERSNIPVSPLTLRASERLGFDPYNLISSGMLLAVIPPETVREAQARLAEAGIESGIAGRFADVEKLSLSTHEELWGILSRV
ncbi:MAG: AIR synthase family protein [Synergistaceae bacterium]|nr:AIR synthase family protein [Synergistaceae bacterium]